MSSDPKFPCSMQVYNVPSFPCQSMVFLANFPSVSNRQNLDFSQTSAIPLPHTPTRLHGPQGPPSRSRAVAPRPETLLHRIYFVDRARADCASAAGGIPGDHESHAASCRQLLYGRAQAGLGGHGTIRCRRSGGRKQDSNQICVKILPQLSYAWYPT